jgi:hypothetical protein
MPSALFEMYQKNFDKSLKNLTEMIELYQNQSKEIQSFTLKEIELNISEMERSISKMELEIIIEKIPDNKKKLNKIITNNKNLVKQYKREIQDLKYKKESILNKNNLVNNINKINDKSPQINILNIPYFEQNNNNNDDEDITLFIDKNNSNKNEFNNCINDEINYKKDESIKRINENNKSDDMNSKTNQNNNLSLSTKKNKNENNKKDKDSKDNKYQLNKDNSFKKIIRIVIKILKYLFNAMINFYKNVIYSGFIKLKHYLNHRYGQANSLRIIMVLFIICFLIIYSFILYIVNSYKIRKAPQPQPVNFVEKNNSIIFESKNKTSNNNTNINSNFTKNITTNISNNTNNSLIKNITNNIKITNNTNITNVTDNDNNNVTSTSHNKNNDKKINMINKIDINTTFGNLSN